jgi:hypothetical protein
MACSGANCAGLTVTETSIPPAKCLNFNHCFPPSERSESDEAAVLRQKLLACETANGALPFLHISAPPSRSTSSLTAPLAADPLRPRRRLGRAKGKGGTGDAFARSQGRAARPRSSDRPALPSLTTPRPLARPAPSRRRSPQLRFDPSTDPVAQVARKAKEAHPPASLGVLLASGNRSLVREAAEATSSLFYNDASVEGR